jgi:hypothetical protein
MRRKRSPINATFGGAALSVGAVFAPGIVVRGNLLGVFASSSPSSI